MQPDHTDPGMKERARVALVEDSAIRQRSCCNPSYAISAPFAAVGEGVDALYNGLSLAVL
jgi:hypothetical protein